MKTVLECEVTYDGANNESPNVWTINKTSRNLLIDLLGSDTSKWLRDIPVETAKTDKGRAIYVDEVKLKQMLEGALD